MSFDISRTAYVFPVKWLCLPDAYRLIFGDKCHQQGNSCMNKTRLRLTLIVMLIVGMFPRVGFAGGAGATFEAEVNGYHVSLSFVSELKTGENEVHVRIVDSQDQFVTPTKVEISVMPIEERGHEATESHGADVAPASAHAEPASGHDNMPGMGTESEPAREHKGVLNFDKSGEWNVVVHFTVGGELLKVDIPVTVVGAISRYGVLAGIFGLNIAIVSAAAIRKRNTAKKSVILPRNPIRRIDR